MGLDITVMQRKAVRCPHCGEVINADWQLGDKGDKGECFCKNFFQIGVF